MNPLTVCRLCNTALIVCICLLYIICITVIVLMPSMLADPLNIFLYQQQKQIENNRKHNQDQVSSIKFYHRKLQNHIISNREAIPTNYFNNKSLQSFKVPLDYLQQQQSNPYNGSNIKLDDIFISVKTTRIFHKSRLDIILDTWYTLAKNQTYFFTDIDDETYRSKLGQHIVNTNCSVSHSRKALCCKMSVEFDYFIDSNKKWWCHFDDDNYVNVPRLVDLLRQFNPLYDWYLGKTSIKQPLEIEDRESKKKIHFSFATGGAGFCISKALALKMFSVASNGRLISVGDRIRLPDDVTIGYIIEHMLSKQLTEVKEFHSHLEPMAMLEKTKLKDQISFSYSGNNIHRNVLELNEIESIRHDSTRFFSLHCYLFPKFCKVNQDSGFENRGF